MQSYKFKGVYLYYEMLLLSISFAFYLVKGKLALL